MPSFVLAIVIPENVLQLSSPRSLRYVTRWVTLCLIQLLDENRTLCISQWSSLVVFSYKPRWRDLSAFVLRTWERLSPSQGATVHVTSAVAPGLFCLRWSTINHQLNQLIFTLLRCASVSPRRRYEYRTLAIVLLYCTVLVDGASRSVGTLATMQSLAPSGAKARSVLTGSYCMKSYCLSPLNKVRLPYALCTLGPCPSSCHISLLHDQIILKLCLSRELGASTRSTWMVTCW